MLTRDVAIHLLASFVAIISQAAGAADRLSEYRSQVVGGDGKSVALFVSEQGEGPPLLLLHGLGASTFTWRHIKATLAVTHRIIAIDLKGFGRSDKPLDTAYSADEQARLVEAFLRKHNLFGVTLAGHSFGGKVAAATALRFQDEPERIQKLVLLSAPVLPGSLPEHYEFVLVPGAPEALVAPLPPDLIARKLLMAARGTADGISQADIDGYAEPYYDLRAKHAFIATARALVADRSQTLAPNLRKLRQPVLLIWCRMDDILPLAGARTLAGALPGARLKILDRCNHLPHEQRPKTTLRWIREFLASE